MQECSEQESGDSRENVLNIIDAFSVPRFTYSVDRKKFLPDDVLNIESPKLYAGMYYAFLFYSVSGYHKSIWISHSNNDILSDKTLPVDIKEDSSIWTGSMYGFVGLSYCWKRCAVAHDYVQLQVSI